MPPIYDYKCENCSKVKEFFAGYEDKVQDCSCGGNMNRLISKNYHVHGDFQPYLDEHLGDKPVWVKSKQHRKQLMKEHKVYEAYGKGWV